MVCVCFLHRGKQNCKTLYGSVYLRLNHCNQVHTPVALLCSLSGKYPWESYEPPYPPSYRFNNNTTVFLGEWL